MRTTKPLLLATLTTPAPLVERVLGWPTEVIRVGSGPLRLVFVPGNPGVASFYASTAQALADTLDAKAAVVSFRGHSMAPLLGPTQAFGLAEQVDHVTSFLEREMATGDEVVVIGHSIGAWVALEAVRVECVSVVRMIIFHFMIVVHIVGCMANADYQLQFGSEV